MKAVSKKRRQSLRAACAAVVGQQRIGIGRSLVPVRTFFEECERRILLASPLTSVPKLHSHAGAPAQIYLDFVGAAPISNWGGVSTDTTVTGVNIPATPAYDHDGDPTTFSASELNDINEIWARVAEKYSPFNIDVTTQDPIVYPHRQVTRVVLGGSYNTWLQAPAGGVALLGSFADSSVSNTCFVFTEDGVFTSKSAAEAAAHEAGHTFGLLHHSIYDANGQKLDDYDPGTPDVAPIMGVSYYSTRGLWNNGPDSDGVNVLQDDLAILSGSRNGFGYRPDDHPGTFFDAVTLKPTLGTVTASGVIEKRTDVDAFNITSGAGTITVKVNPASNGPMLDASVKLVDPFGGILGQAATSSLGESFTVNVPGGQYSIQVSSAGGYGDLGQYTVTATLPAGGVVSGTDHYFVQGTNTDDNISVNLVDGAYKLDINGTVSTIDPATIKQFDILSGDGDDVITIGPGVTGTYVLAGAGDDTVFGGDNADTINGSAGNDVLWGGDGDDRLTGGPGRDQIYAGAGRDRLYGEGENDILVGGPGVDRIYGGDGNDVLSGEGGDDKLYGENGIDTIVGGDGSDLLNGGDQVDTLYGMAGNDQFYTRGDGLPDFISGGTGNNSAQIDDGVDTVDSVQTLLA